MGAKWVVALLCAFLVAEPAKGSPCIPSQACQDLCDDAWEELASCEGLVDPQSGEECACGGIAEGCVGSCKAACKQAYRETHSCEPMVDPATGADCACDDLVSQCWRRARPCVEVTECKSHSCQAESCDRGVCSYDFLGEGVYEHGSCDLPCGRNRFAACVGGRCRCVRCLSDDDCPDKFMKDKHCNLDRGTCEHTPIPEPPGSCKAVCKQAYRDTNSCAALVEPETGAPCACKDIVSQCWKKAKPCEDQAECSSHRCQAESCDQGVCSYDFLGEGMYEHGSCDLNCGRNRFATCVGGRCRCVRCLSDDDCPDKQRRTRHCDLGRGKCLYSKDPSPPGAAELNCTSPTPIKVCENEACECVECAAASDCVDIPGTLKTCEEGSCEYSAIEEEGEAEEVEASVADELNCTGSTPVKACRGSSCECLECLHDGDCPDALDQAKFCVPEGGTCEYGAIEQIDEALVLAMVGPAELTLPMAMESVEAVMVVEEERPTVVALSKEPPEGSSCSTDEDCPEVPDANKHCDQGTCQYWMLSAVSTGPAELNCTAPTLVKACDGDSCSCLECLTAADCPDVAGANKECETEGGTCEYWMLSATSTAPELNCTSPTPVKSCEGEACECVECAVDDDCGDTPGTLKTCQQGACQYSAIEEESKAEAAASGSGELICPSPTPIKVCENEACECVECAAASDCGDIPGTLKTCEEGACEYSAIVEESEAATTANVGGELICTSPTPIKACDGEACECVECADADDCDDVAKQTKSCNTEQGICEYSAVDEGDEPDELVCTGLTPIEACEGEVCRCVECAADDDCGDTAGTLKTCQQGTCEYSAIEEESVVEAAASGELICASPTPIKACQGEDCRCIECLVDGDCPALQPQSAACEQGACTYSAAEQVGGDAAVTLRSMAPPELNCTSPTPVKSCEGEACECVECAADDDCGDTPGTLKTCQQGACQYSAIEPDSEAATSEEIAASEEPAGQQRSAELPGEPADPACLPPAPISICKGDLCRCVECASEADCEDRADHTKACEVASGTCSWTAVKNQELAVQCPSSAPILACSLEGGGCRCVECGADSDCPDVEDQQKFCDVGGGACEYEILSAALIDAPEIECIPQLPIKVCEGESCWCVECQGEEDCADVVGEQKACNAAKGTCEYTVIVEVLVPANAASFRRMAPALPTRSFGSF